MKRNKSVIGLFGFGVVGQGVFELLEKTPGIEATIKRICVRDIQKPRKAGKEYFTSDKDEILEDPEINVVIEVTDDAATAFEIVSTALKNGKAVISANKKMLAEHLEELIALQRKYNQPLLYEAACCASVPIIRNLEEYYDNDLLESIEGIVNGSSNYILTQTIEEGLSYAEALKNAQEKGFAESDPRADVEGYDAKYKLQLIIAHAFGKLTHADEIPNWGISDLSETALHYAQDKNLKIKLIAHAFRTKEGAICGLVAPQFIPLSNRLSSVNGVYNGVQTKSVFYDRQFFVGKGAGAYPTASAILSDLSALSYSYKYEYKKLNKREVLSADENVYLRVLWTGDRQIAQTVAPFFLLTEEIHLKENGNYIIGIVDLDTLKQLHRDGLGSFVLIDFPAFNELPKQEKIEEYAIA